MEIGSNKQMHSLPSHSIISAPRNINSIEMLGKRQMQENAWAFVFYDCQVYATLYGKEALYAWG